MDFSYPVLCHCEEGTCSLRRSNLLKNWDCFGRKGTALAMTEIQTKVDEDEGSPFQNGVNLSLTLPSP